MTGCYSCIFFTSYSFPEKKKKKKKDKCGQCGQFCHYRFIRANWNAEENYSDFAPINKNAMGCLFFWVQISKGLCVYVLNWHNTNIYENDSVI